MFLEDSKRVMRGGISGKESAMTLKKALREMLLNWFVRSKKTATREGRMPVDCGREMYLPLVVALC